MSYLDDITQILVEMQTDNTVPRNIKLRLTSIQSILTSRDEHQIKVSKAMQELDDVTDDVNMQPYTRTQIYSLVSLLEQLGSN